MAIGISYTDAGGQTYGMSAQNAQSALAGLQSIMSQTEKSALDVFRKRRASAGSFVSRGMSNEEYHRLKEMRRAEREAKKAAHEDAKFFAEGAKGGLFGKAKAAAERLAQIARGLIGFNSSIEEANGKIRLVGDGRVVNAGDVYGKDTRGLKGFWPIIDLVEGMDVRKIGKMIGNSDSTDAELDASERLANDDKPFAESCVTRVISEQLKDTDPESATYGRSVTTLYAFVRDRYYTGHGRLFAIGKERMQTVCRLDSSSSASGGCGRFEINKTTTSGSFTFDNPYYNVGGKTYSMLNPSVSGANGKIVALRINATGTSTAATIEKYSDFTALQSAQSDMNYYTTPLYTISADGEVALDWRVGPNAAMGEF